MVCASNDDICVQLNDNEKENCVPPPHHTPNTANPTSELNLFYMHDYEPMNEFVLST